MTSDAPQPPAIEPASRNLARSVAEDLGPIFAAAGERPAGAAAGRSRVRALGPAARRNRLPIATVGAVLSAGLVGLSIGGLLVHPGGAGKPRPAAAARPAGPPIIVAEAAAPPTAPAPAQPDPVRPVAREDVPSEKVTRVHGARRHAAHKTVRTAHVSWCAGLNDGERAWCSHRAVMAADDRLRQAYHTAARAGVSRPVLVSYRQRWETLRSRAASEPGEVAAGYSAMASDLSRMADDRRRSGQHASRGSWFWG